MKRILALILAALLLLSGCGFVPAASDAAPLDFTELAPVFALTDDALMTRFGEPDQETVTSYTGLLASEFRYGRNVFRTESHSGAVYYACIYDDAIPGPRGVAVGMKPEEVTALFAAEAGHEPAVGQDGVTFRLLYGDYEEGYNYGAVLYEGSAARLIEYGSEGCILACGLRGGRVEYIEYIFGYFADYTTQTPE